MSYCTFCASEPAGSVHKLYHDTQYGFPLASDDELFGRLLLEINQAGLSWTTILNKQHNFRRAYSGFSVATIAAYTEADRARLLGDAGIIRNRLKVNAAVVNAATVLRLQSEHGSFLRWLERQQSQGLDREAWTKLFKKTFVFTGGEIVNEFLVSCGFLPGAHDEDCPVRATIRP
ncbi:MAG: DNA-3-methyladenine glycosylase I [Spirochaetales bacterium]